jgi:hypothetical protein
VCYNSQDATNALFDIGWGEYPVEIATIQEGMSLGTDDADTVQSKSFVWDFDTEGVNSIGAILAVTTGAEGTFTFAETCWSIAQSFSVINSTGNDGDYQTKSFTRSGANVIVTVVGSIPDGTVDGDIAQTIVITPANGSITVQRQETQR